MKSDDHISAAQMDELRKFMSEAIPYWKTLGLELIEVAPGHAVFEARSGPASCRTTWFMAEYWLLSPTQLVPLRPSQKYFLKATPQPSIFNSRT